MESARRQFAMLGKKPPRALPAANSGPQCPPAARYLWNYFLEISLGLASSGFAPAVVTWEALISWCTLRGMSLEPWESLALVQLGALRADIIAEKNKAS